MTEKKPYSPPQLFRVELNQEQAILSACSLTTMSTRQFTRQWLSSQWTMSAARRPGRLQKIERWGSSMP